MSVCLCTCVRMCLCVHVCVRMCVHVCSWTTGHQMSSLGMLSTSLEKRSLISLQLTN